MGSRRETLSQGRRSIQPHHMSTVDGVSTGLNIHAEAARARIEALNALYESQLSSLSQVGHQRYPASVDSSALGIPMRVELGNEQTLGLESAMPFSAGVAPPPGL